MADSGMITIRARVSVMYRHRTPSRRRKLVDKIRPDMAIFFYFPPSADIGQLGTLITWLRQKRASEQDGGRNRSYGERLPGRDRRVPS